MKLVAREDAMKSKSRPVVSCVAGMLTIAALLVLCGFDWPRWRGPNGDGISAETDWNPQALANGPKILWETSVGFGASNVAIRGKYLYTMGGDARNDAILCVEAETGEMIWKYSYECRDKSYGAPSTPAVDGESVYTLSPEGHVHCLDALSGKVRWLTHIVKECKAVRPTYGFAASPVVEGDLVIINVNSSGIALDKNTGEIAWQSPPVDWRGDKEKSTGSEYSTPTIYTQSGKRYAVGSNAYGLYSVEAVTGAPNWLFEIVGPYCVRVADPIVVNSRVFASNLETGSVFLDIGGARPRVLWQNQYLKSYIVNAVLVDGFIYGSDGDSAVGIGVLRCLDINNGKLMWERDLGRPVSISGAGNLLLLLTDRGKLFIAEASPNSYKEIASAQVFAYKGASGPNCWTPPVLCGGRIYCKNIMGKIVCVDVRK